MKLFIAFLLAVAAPAAVSAQEFFIGNEVYDMYTRLYRDRSVRFQSARADALQMRLATDEESYELTLENWADNRADLKAGGSRLKLEANTTGGEYHDPEKWDVSGNRLGAYGRFGRLEVEGLFAAQKSERLNTTTRSEYNRLSGGAAYAFGPENLSFGVHANVNRSGDEGWNEVNENNSLGAALVYRTDLYELGAAADLVARGTKDEDANYDVPRNGPQFGAQAMLKPFKGFKAALRGSMAKLTGDGANSGATEYKNYKADHNELGARLEWELESLPLTFGLEYAKLFFDPNYTANGVFKKSEMEFDLKSAGVALRLLDERLLLGAELRDFDGTMTNTSGTTVGENELKSTTLTAGAELWVLPSLAARASYQRMSTDDTPDDVFGNILAAGVGFKGEKYTLDAALRRYTPDEDADEKDLYTDVRLTFGMKF